MKIALLSSLILIGCVSRQEVEGNIWSMDRIPKSICDQNPSLYKYGSFRVISCKGSSVPECKNGEESYDEVVSYCSARGGKMKSADGAVVDKWLNKLGKPK